MSTWQQSQVASSKSYKRTVATASKPWPCWADCGDPIPKGEDVILDTFRDGFNTTSIRWHFKCAPTDRRLIKQILHDAVNVKKVGSHV